MSVETFKCKTCAAPIGFNIEAGKWKCEYCGNEFEKHEIEPFTGPANDIEFDYSQSSEVPELEEYRCKACGAQILADEQTAATFCIYCRSSSIIHGRFAGEFRPQLLIPFKINQKEAEKLYHTWIKKRFFCPASFKNAREISHIRGLYAPYWLFDCSASGYISGEGRDTRSWTSGDYRYTETKYYHFKRAGMSDYRKIPIDGSEKLDDALMEGIEPFQYGALQPFAVEFMAGHLAERYDVDQDKAVTCMMPRARTFLATTLEGQGRRYSSMTVQNTNINVHRIKGTYAMLPVYVLTNLYQKGKHTFMVNGQTGKIYGETPVDKVKVVWVLFVVYAMSMLVTLLGGVYFEIF